ncbi:MAG: hypothetical protein J0I06_08795 [Planctomycetes bacterium]|nr:hypothetical protein [Planctomycetota bacterium]
MKTTRSLQALDRAVEARCRCGLPPRFLLLTVTELEGRYAGTGKRGERRTYRCASCVAVPARRYGLIIPGADET